MSKNSNHKRNRRRRNINTDNDSSKQKNKPTKASKVTKTKSSKVTKPSNTGLGRKKKDKSSPIATRQTRSRRRQQYADELDVKFWKKYKLKELEDLEESDSYAIPSKPTFDYRSKEQDPMKLGDITKDNDHTAEFDPDKTAWRPEFDKEFKKLDKEIDQATSKLRKSIIFPKDYPKEKLQNYGCWSTDVPCPQNDDGSHKKKMFFIEMRVGRYKLHLQNEEKKDDNNKEKPKCSWYGCQYNPHVISNKKDNKNKKKRKDKKCPTMPIYKTIFWCPGGECKQHYTGNQWTKPPSNNNKRKRNTDNNDQSIQLTLCRKHWNEYRKSKVHTARRGSFKG